MLHRVLPLSSRLIASPSTNGTFLRSMSAGSKRDNKNGLPVRRAGGITLPTENEVEDASGRIRYKSRKQLEKEEYHQEKRENGAFTEEDMKLDEEDGLDELDEAEEPYDSQYARNDREREPLRPGEQSWRERTLKQSGILQNAPFRQAAREKLRKQPLKPSVASKNNPVLIRTREHLNQADLPPAFDHFKVPPLTAEEIDAKQKELHASYWSKYIAWKEARPDEYAKWLARLEKREEEQQFHWQHSQLGKHSGASKEIAALKSQASKKLLPTAQSRASFDEARKNDPSLDAAIKQLGEGEVLRRWNTYQVFLEAEIAADHKERVANYHIKTKLKRDRALFAEDTLTTLNDDTLKLNVAQKKKLYGMMLGAQYRVNQAPFWTDPDPRFEGEHDWKMADAFVKPPVLPPLHLLKEYSARPETNSNFSSLHRFLHFERLRQTVHFLKEQRRQQTRERKRQLEFNPSEYIQSLVKDCKEWPHIMKDYSFLSDTVFNGARHLHLSPWPTADQRDFLDALLRNVVTISKLLDVHFNRRNRNAAWILPFPNNPKRNPDEILKPMTQREMKQMEAEVLASQMMEVLESGEEIEPPTSSSPLPDETTEDQQPATAEK